MREFQILLAAAAALLASCQNYQARTGVEARAMLMQAQDELYSEADEAVGPAIAVASLPVQGGHNLWGWELGAAYGDDAFDLPGGEYQLEQSSAWAGVRYTILDGHVRPYLAAGLQYTKHEVTLDFGGMRAVRGSDDIGPYGEAGVQFRLAQAWHMTLGYRQTFDLEGGLGAVPLDLDTKQGFFGIGWSF